MIVNERRGNGVEDIRSWIMEAIKGIKGSCSDPKLNIPENRQKFHIILPQNATFVF